MATDDFSRARLDSMIDMRHPLAVLATRMPWAAIEASLASLLAHKDRDGRLAQGADFFGPTAQLAGAGLSNAGRPRLALRLMVALLYLKHAFNLSWVSPASSNCSSPPSKRPCRWGQSKRPSLNASSWTPRCKRRP